MSGRNGTRIAAAGYKTDLRASLAAPVLACLALIVGVIILTLA